MRSTVPSPSSSLRKTSVFDTDGAAEAERGEVPFLPEFFFLSGHPLPSCPALRPEQDHKIRYPSSSELSSLTGTVVNGTGPYYQGVFAAAFWSSREAFIRFLPSSG